MIGRVFDDRYEVIKKLGSGGMADVYLAQDRLLGRQVAIKILSSRYAHDEQFIERFRREASSAASLNHPNIVSIYDRGEAEGTYYIAMEYLEGRSLKEIILKYAPLSPDLVVSVSVQILEALRFAHRRDVIHRDIKPQNIIIDNDGRVKVTDFGIARAGSASTMTEAGSILGTAHYLSPEQAQGQPVEAASDLYSLGVVMYEMVTGKLPYDGDNPVTIAMQHVHDSPTPPRSINPELPENLEAVILRSLGKKPTDRYLTAQAFLDDLKRVQQGQDVSVPAAFVEEATQVMTPAMAAAVSSAQPTQIRQRVPAEPVYAAEYQEERRRRGSVWPWVLVLILIVALAGGAYAIFSAWGAGASADTAVVPRLVGLTEAQAKQKVQDANLEFKVAGTEASSDVAEGNVVRQDPADGTNKKKGDTVSVWVSAGKGQAKVPDVVGKSQVDAVKELTKAGFDPTVKTEANDTVPEGSVIRQNPAGGKSAEKGASVTIVVATALNTVAVPDVSNNMNQAQAEQVIRSMNLVPRVEMIDSTETGGTVVRQSPEAGEKVAPGSEVTIFVSNAPLPTTVTVPPVAGLSLSAAVARLKLYSLTPKITYQDATDRPPNQVIEQHPTAGLKVEKGSTVELVVSRTPPTTTTTLPPSTDTTSPETTETTLF